MEDALLIYLVEVLFICTFTCGLKLVTAEGKILEPFKKLIEKKKLKKVNGNLVMACILPAYLRNPLLSCVYCMPTIWGTIIYWTTILSMCEFHWWYFILWLLVWMSSSYFNLFFFRPVEKIVK